MQQAHLEMQIANCELPIHSNNQSAIDNRQPAII